MHYAGMLFLLQQGLGGDIEECLPLNRSEVIESVQLVGELSKKGIDGSRFFHASNACFGKDHKRIAFANGKVEFHSREIIDEVPSFHVFAAKEINQQIKELDAKNRGFFVAENTDSDTHYQYVLYFKKNNDCGVRSRNFCLTSDGLENFALSITKDLPDFVDYSEKYLNTSVAVTVAA